MISAQKEVLLTETEVCEVLGLRPRTLQGWRLFGRGPKFVKLSKRIIRYRWVDVQAWLDDIQNRNKQELT